MKTNNLGTGITGIRIDQESGKPIEVEEHEHFYVCRACGQSVDMRDFGQIFHHEEDGHEPLRLDA